MKKNCQTIFTCEYRTEADVKVYVTNYRNEAGWRNEEKKHLMEG